MKKVFALMGLMSVLVLGLTEVSYAEGNWSDTKFKFNFGDWQPYSGWKTEKRVKRDYTSSYMSCKSSNGRSYTAEVMGAKSKTDEWAYDVGSPAYRFSEGYTYYMTNYVKEKKYTYATIMATPNSSGHFVATGYWSPDSI